MDILSTRRDDISEVVNAYDDIIVRAYCWARFKILRQRFLYDIGQYLPSSGCALDIGCGFGLFSLYYAKKFPNLTILGIDINPDRIRMAKRAATKLSLSNVRYEVNNATSIELQRNFNGIYMLDIVHHIPRQAVLPLLEKLYAMLNPGCRLIIKDVDTKPAYKRWFTHMLDKIMDPRAQVSYWGREELANLLKNLGFEVFCHSMLIFYHTRTSCTFAERRLA